MEKDFKIFGDKNFSDLSQEIYENSKLKKTQIELLVQEVHGYIQGIEDIAVVGPIPVSYTHLTLPTNREV